MRNRAKVLLRYCLAEGKLVNRESKCITLLFIRNETFASVAFLMVLLCKY